MIAWEPLDDGEFVKKVMSCSRRKFWSSIDNEVLDSARSCVRLDNLFESFDVLANGKLFHVEFKMLSKRIQYGGLPRRKYLRGQLEI